MEAHTLLNDPAKFISLCWPNVVLYDKQVEILCFLRDHDTTLCVAGNQLGKDFISAYSVLWFFCSRSPCRIITSSSGQAQLESVLWGEMKRAIDTATYPLPIKYNHMQIRQYNQKGDLVPLSYILGIVTNVPENLQGHHLARGADGRPRTMVVFDEASSISDEYYDASDTWAHRKLIIGNPLPCENFFRRGVRDGNQEGAKPGHRYRNVIRIKAEDSPNVQLGLNQVKAGIEPTYEQRVPGVIDYALYLKRRATWDKIRQCVGLDAEFYEGAEILMYPPEWLNRAESIAAILSNKVRHAKTIGVDTAEGGDKTVWTVIDELGILFQLAILTPDTAVISNRTIALMREYNVKAENVLFDRGGGGKQHSDYLRTKGHNVRTVAFGEGPTAPETKTHGAFIPQLKVREDIELKYVYKNRRAEMYGILRYNLLDPISNERGFGIPAELAELRRQLAPIPILYDEEGRIYLPPKNRRKGNESKQQTMSEMIGCSPDEADSLVLAVFGMLMKPTKKLLGAY